MANLKIEPLDPMVARFIECYWYIEKTPADKSPDFPGLNPDPSGHLIIADPQQPYEYKNDLVSAAGRGSHLILPNSKTIRINHSRPFRIIGIKFQVRAIYSLKLASPQNLIDQIIPFDLSTFSMAPALRETSLFRSLEDSPESLRNLLDEYLHPFLAIIKEDRHSGLVRDILGLGCGTKLSDISLELGCSQRTVERSFLRVTGLTLKQYYTMSRLELLLFHLYHLDEKNIRWADIAQNFGFSDQPHLVRYLKNSIGNTPGEYAKKRNLTIDAYGDFE